MRRLINITVDIIVDNINLKHYKGSVLRSPAGLEVIRGKRP
ncbi:MAG: hypothetical protein ACP5IZ_07430 [Thermoprotei archaeon]